MVNSSWADADRGLFSIGIRRVLQLLEETPHLEQELAALRALAARSSGAGPAAPDGSGDVG